MDTIKSKVFTRFTTNRYHPYLCPCVELRYTCYDTSVVSTLCDIKTVGHLEEQIVADMVNGAMCRNNLGQVYKSREMLKQEQTDTGDTITTYEITTRTGRPYNAIGMYCQYRSVEMDTEYFHINPIHGSSHRPSKIKVYKDIKVSWFMEMITRAYALNAMHGTPVGVLNERGAYALYVQSRANRGKRLNECLPHDAVLNNNTGATVNDFFIK